STNGQAPRCTPPGWSGGPSRLIVDAAGYFLETVTVNSSLVGTVQVNLDVLVSRKRRLTGGSTLPLPFLAGYGFPSSSSSGSGGISWRRIRTWCVPSAAPERGLPLYGVCISKEPSGWIWP